MYFVLEYEPHLIVMQKGACHVAMKTELIELLQMQEQVSSKSHNHFVCECSNLPVTVS